MNVLIDYAEDVCRKVHVPDTLLNKQIFSNIPVYDGMLQGELISKVSLQLVTTTEQKELVMIPGEQLKLIYELPSGLQAPLVEDEVVGKVHYTINGQTLLTESLTVGMTITKMNFIDCYRMESKYFLLNY